MEASGAHYSGSGSISEWGDRFWNERITETQELDASGNWTRVAGVGTGTGSGSTHSTYSGDGTYDWVDGGGIPLAGTWWESGGNHSRYSSRYDTTLDGSGSFVTTGSWTQTASHATGRCQMGMQQYWRGLPRFRRIGRT